MNFELPDIRKLPDLRVNRDGVALPAQHVTMDNVLYVVHSMGLQARFDVSAAVTVYASDDADISDDVMQEQAELAIIDMCTRLGMKGDAKIREILHALSRGVKYHPMEDWMKGLVYGGEDHIGRLIDSVDTDNNLWPTYLENWLIQVVEGVCGWRDGEMKKSLPYVLVLVGSQGVGKSRWFKRVGGPWLKGEAELHLSSPSSKDHQLEALKYPMVELSELDGIFRKSDISHMKAFISREVDSIRAPYERRALVRPRMTVFCGSVNDAEFLNDGTGSRRFWPVQVDRIDWDADIDLEQLWAQAYALWQENSDFNLTPEEDAERMFIAETEHLSRSDETETISEYLRLHCRNPKFPEKAMSALDVLRMLYGSNRTFNNKQKSDASAAVCAILGKHRTIDGKQRAWLVPFNNLAIDKASWPDKISLK